MPEDQTGLQRNRDVPGVERTVETAGTVRGSGEKTAGFPVFIEEKLRTFQTAEMKGISVAVFDRPGIAFADKLPADAVGGFEMGSGMEFSRNGSFHILGEHFEFTAVVPDEGVFHIESGEDGFVLYAAIGAFGGVGDGKPDPQSFRSVAPVVKIDASVRENAGGGIGDDLMVPVSRSGFQHRMVQRFPWPRGRIRNGDADADSLIDGVRESPVMVCDPGVFLPVGCADVIEQKTISVTENRRIVCHASVPGGGIGTVRENLFDEAVRAAHRFRKCMHDFGLIDIADEHRILFRPSGGVHVIAVVPLENGTAPDPAVLHAEAAG